MKALKKTYGSHFKDKTFLASFVVSFLFLTASLVINFYAGLYALEKASNSVTDIILSNIQTYNVEDIFTYGLWFFFIFVALVIISKPYKIPFILKNIGLFLIVRSVFITLTHIGPFPTQIVIPATKLISDFSSGGDLFFSGHTGLPFLMALIFWDNKLLRYIFIASSIFFGTVVLLGHLHYSIDVLGAFFITYTIYHIAEVIFKKDKELFESGISAN